MVYIVKSLIVLIALIIITKKMNHDTIRRMLANIWIALTPLIVFFIMEQINNLYGVWSINIKYWIANIIILMVIFALLYYICFPYKITIVMFYCVTIIFSVSNYYVNLFRGGNAIKPADLLALKTAVNVSSSYVFKMTDNILKWVTVAVTCCIYAVWISRFSNVKLKIKKRICIGSLLCIFAIGSFKGIDLTSGYYSVRLDYWQISTSYYKYGIPMTFLTLCQNTTIKKPENYSKKQVVEILDSYKENEEQEQLTIDEKKPTVIAIMNESLSDLSIIRDFKCEPEYMPFWNSFNTPIMKGNLFVSVFGGGTCNTEFEFLTGNTMGNLPQGSYPYQQYSLKRASSLAHEFKNNGYDTVAIHPGNPESWNREKAFSDIGFDEFITKKDFVDPEYIGNFISDHSCYNKIIEEFEHREKEKFIFAVTIQNHGGYDDSRLSDNDMVQLEPDLNTYSGAREYLTLMKKADEALKELFAYFEKVDSPVIICVFGDHQPFISEEFYEKLFGHSIENLSSEERVKRFKTPYLIWSNYDTGKTVERRNTSANFLGTLLLNIAGQLKNPFFRYIYSMQQEITEMNVEYYRTKDGVLHGLNDQDEKSRMWLKQYQAMQYYEMFDQ